MHTLIKTVILSSGAFHLMLAQDSSEMELGRLLASKDSREGAVKYIVSRGQAMERVLFTLRDNPPLGIDRRELNIGLADSFGALRTRKAIPFLIDNIGIRRWFEAHNWLKSGEVIENRLPAVHALIQIGPDSLDALFHAYSGRLGNSERLAIVFVVSRIKDPRCRDFLQGIQGEVETMQRWASDGLNLLDKR